jgi:hypothetical protein
MPEYDEETDAIMRRMAEIAARAGVSADQGPDLEYRAAEQRDRGSNLIEGMGKATATLNNTDPKVWNNFTGPGAVDVLKSKRGSQKSQELASWKAILGHLRGERNHADLQEHRKNSLEAIKLRTDEGRDIAAENLLEKDVQNASPELAKTTPAKANVATIDSAIKEFDETGDVPGYGAVDATVGRLPFVADMFGIDSKKNNDVNQATLNAMVDVILEASGKASSDTERAAILEANGLPSGRNFVTKAWSNLTTTNEQAGIGLKKLRAKAEAALKGVEGKWRPDVIARARERMNGNPLAPPREASAPPLPTSQPVVEPPNPSGLSQQEKQDVMTQTGAQDVRLSPEGRIQALIGGVWKNIGSR